MYTPEPQENVMDTASVGGTLLGIGIGALVLYLIYLLIAGVIVGALARLVLPGPDPMGWLVTMGYGIAGSILGGIVGGLLGLGRFAFVLSIACAAGLIWYLRRRKKKPDAGAAPPGP
jgi:uncharacterized membrane protein YeaQ/YmgE (transglycosylase-associated protein family)